MCIGNRGEEYDLWREGGGQKGTTRRIHILLASLLVYTQSSNANGLDRLDSGGGLGTTVWPNTSCLPVTGAEMPKACIGELLFYKRNENSCVYDFSMKD